MTDDYHSHSHPCIPLPIKHTTVRVLHVQALHPEMSQNNADCTLRASSTIECSHTSHNDWVINLNKSLREGASSRGEEPRKDLESIVEALICTAQHSRDVNNKSEKINLAQQALEWNHCVSGRKLLYYTTYVLNTRISSTCCTRSSPPQRQLPAGTIADLVSSL
jgi:hypothetical protein